MLRATGLLALLAVPGLAAAATADIGGPYTVDAESSVTIDASGSYCDSGWYTEYYVWDLDADGTTDDHGYGDSTTFDASGFDGPTSQKIELEFRCYYSWSGYYVDDDGINVTIDNVDPVISGVTTPGTVDEGTSGSFSVSYSDVEAADTHTFDWDLGDGDTGSASSLSHTYTDDGSFTVTIEVCDDDGGCVDSSATVTVNNVAPTASGSPGTTAQEGVEYTFTPTCTDPGTDDTFVWTSSVPSGASVSSSDGTVTWTPDYADEGSHVMGLKCWDDDGAGDWLTWTLTVTVTDDDGDGMADSWEDDVGLDSSDPSDASDDDDGDGRTNLQEFGDDTDPFVYDGPDEPVPTSPADGAEVEDAVFDLVVTNATSPGGDTLSYNFEWYSDSSMSVWVGDAMLVTEGVGSTTTEVSTGLTENTWYWWWANAEDDYTIGDWSSVSSFFYNTVNDAPTTPAISSPFDGGSAASLQPILAADPSTDADGDAFSYTFALTDSEGGLIEEVGDLGDDGVVVDHKVVTTLTENVEYCWTAWATDEHGLDSVADGPACFLVDLTNEAPSAPVILSPTDGESLLSVDLLVQVSDGVDPEGRATVHRFELSTDTNFSDATVAEIDADGSGQTDWSVPGLTDNTDFHLRVRAEDGATASEWDRISFRVNTENDPPTAPTLYNPADGASWAAGDSMSVLNATDPDGDVLSYSFQIFDGYGELAQAVQGLAESSSGTTTWTPTELPSGTYTWSAQAVDEWGLAGDWADARTVVVAGGGPDDPGGRSDDPGGSGDGDLAWDAQPSGCACTTAESAQGRRLGGVLFVGGLFFVGFRRRR